MTKISATEARSKAAHYTLMAGYAREAGMVAPGGSYWAAECARAVKRRMKLARKYTRIAEKLEAR